MSKKIKNNQIVKDNQARSRIDTEVDQKVHQGNSSLPVLSTSKSPVVQDPIYRYIREVMKFPTLTPEEEIELARRVKKYKDREAALKLVTSHLRLVVKIAMEFQRKWMQNLLELIQEGKSDNSSKRWALHLI